MKMKMAVLLASTALIAAPAAAQAPAAQQNAPAQAPAAQTAPAAPAGQARQTGQAAGQTQYITENRGDLWRATELTGMTVYNEQNESIGDISEVLLTRDGQIEAVVIGVGGFLGIGQRDVAVPFDALQWQMTDANRTAGAPATGMQPPAGTARPASERATTGAAADMNRDRPARVVLRGASKEQLNNAPEFKYAR